MEYNNQKIDLHSLEIQSGKWKLYDDMMEKGWDGAHLLTAGKNLEFDGAIRIKYELLQALDLLYKVGQKEFSMSSFPKWEDERDYTSAWMKFAFDEQKGFYLNKITVDNGYKKLVQEIPKGHYFPGRYQLCESLERQRSRNVRRIILPRQEFKVKPGEEKNNGLYI